MQEKLCSMLRDVLRNKPNVDVVKLQKSGGVVSRNAKFRQKARSYRIRASASDLKARLTLTRPFGTTNGSHRRNIRTHRWCIGRDLG